MKKYLLATTLVIVSTTVAQSADLTARPYTKAPITPPAFNWSGMYVGAHAGYGWTSPAADSLVDFNVKPEGAFGGGQIGYNYQFSNRAIVGLEVDASFTGMKSDSLTVRSDGGFIVTSTSSAFRVDSFGTVRGRFGYAFERLLPYVTGGFAWANTKMDYSQSTTFLGAPFAILSDLHQSKLRTGWAIGAGAEYALADHWSAKIEYMYSDFGREDYTGVLLPTFGGSPFNASTKLTMQTVKLGVNYRF